jgi:hypothetical protein
VRGAADVAPPLLSHCALFYGVDDEFLAATLPFLRAGVDRSEPVLAVTSAARIGLLQDALAGDARHVEFAESSWWYRSPVDALNGYRDFLHQRVSEGAPWVRILGEPVWAGRSSGERLAWARYESLLNLTFAASPATIVCPYDRSSLAAEVLASASQTHPETAAAGDGTASSAYRSPEEFLLAVDH